jgi:Ca2+-binding RTX toxin-like protein
MKSRRWYLATAVALGIITLAGCAAEGPESNQPANNDWGDPDAYPDLGGSFHSLTALDGTCAWNSTTGVMTVTATANANQTIIIGGRADNVITVNGAPLCAGTSVTKAVLKGIVVTPAGTVASDTGNQIVIIDYINGFFASGTTTGAGVKVNLGGGTGDALRVRGTSNIDNFTFGVPVVSATVPVGTMGLATGTDTARDMEALGVESFSVSLGGGADILTGAGGPAVGANSAVFTLPLIITGGAGNDTITGGTAADTLSGGDGDDTLYGAAGADSLNGEAGNDVFPQGAAADGGDTIVCGSETSFVEGAETDTVSYALRTLAVNVTLAAVGTPNDGDVAAAGEGDDIDVTCEIVTGGAGNDTLTGDLHKNVLNGGVGNDTLNGGLQDDTLNGGVGNDSFVESGVVPSGADTFNGGDGTDTVDYSSRTAVMTIIMDGTAASGESGETDTVKIDVENVIGGAEVDTITGNASDNVIAGGLGADVLHGAAGNDVFSEGAVDTGGDTFDGGDGLDTVDYTARVAAITVTIGAGADDGLASENDDVTSTVENVMGASGAYVNTLTGDGGDNELTGGAGSDVLTGGLGNDILDGGSAGTDTLACGAGEDIAYGGGTLTLTSCEL